MEKRKNSLSAIKVCRFCLSQDEPLQSLYDRSSEQKNSVPLPLKILSCVSVEVFPSDKMPLFICNRCTFFMGLSYGYKQICRQADESILQFVQSGTALEPIVWPPSLVKAFRSGSKMSQDFGVVKTVVEGGATVEVTQDVSDSDDDEENVYNIKIGEGSDEGSACIKVVTSKDNHNIAKTKPKGPNQVYVSSGASERYGGEAAHASGALSDGCWPCDECECTYPLQQLLELHKMQKHRARNVPCDQCDAKFFSKYDLMTHQLRHSDEMPFQCVACDKMFKRLVLLKRHEKLMHSDLPQLKCPNCPATFLSVEELEAHQSRHNLYGQRAFACTLCDKKFNNRGSVQRHRDAVHVQRGELSCEYCPERFSSVSKLTKHVRSHAGDRPYPCKYCDKSFLKSHHYTRHLRLKHREMMGRLLDLPDAYRCEQCGETFATQDDHIYHSAIHATQNLTCPLCQEKFEDVDAVTAHIKSHVNGTEFMCDYCELVFTSKEKLDGHIAVTHEEEASQLQDMTQNESSMEIDAEEDEDDNTINLKEEDDHMVVEIKKSDSFMITNPQPEIDEKMDNTNSEESESEATYLDLATVDTLAMMSKTTPVMAPPENPPVKLVAATFTPKTVIKIEQGNDIQTASILRKAEEIKRKAVQQQSTEASIPEKKEKPAALVSKVESSSSTGGNDKSLRILEKELQELKRTKSRNDASKTAAKLSESSVRSSRRPQPHTSTPKLRSVDEKKPQAPPKIPAADKKVPERRAIKENKEQKEGKDAKTVSTTKDEKEVKAINSSAKEDTKEIDTTKSVVKNGNADKSVADDSIRRSTRPSKVKDYAKMIRERSQADTDEDDSDDDDDEYVETEKTPESRSKTRRTVKPPPKVVKPSPTPPAPGVRKRGRPRREQPVEVPVKVVKKEANEDEAESKPDKIAEAMQESGITKVTPAAPEREKRNSNEKKDAESKTKVDENSNADTNKTANADKPVSGVLVSPTGQTLKQVPIESLPPGVRPIALSLKSRTKGTGELCEMQIGKKVVKVQKIVMTKAEVEAMAKKGLVEMKDGTIVLKQGIKLPTSDSTAIRCSLVGQESQKESPSKKDKAAPTRCELTEDL